MGPKRSMVGGGEEGGYSIVPPSSDLSFSPSPRSIKGHQTDCRLLSRRRSREHFGNSITTSSQSQEALIFGDFFKEMVSVSTEDSHLVDTHLFSFSYVMNYFANLVSQDLECLLSAQNNISPNFAAICKCAKRRNKSKLLSISPVEGLLHVRVPNAWLNILFTQLLVL